MDNINKGFAVILILIIAISIPNFLIVKSANAQSISKPSVPEFTIQFIGPSQNVSTTYKLDVVVSAIQITIKNQPFIPQTTQDNYSVYEWTTALYYNVQSKLHSSESWDYWYPVDEGFPTPSNSDYTVLTYEWDGSYLFTANGHAVHMPNGTQMDFQVQAMNGYIHRVVVGHWAPYEFFGEKSDWSNTKTITTPALINAIPSSTPTVPEFSLVIVIAIVITVLTLAVSVFKRKIQ